MKAVLDTNIAVSAFLSPFGIPASILHLVLNNDLDMCFNTAILAEYEEVLCRTKFAGRVSQTGMRRFIAIIYTLGNNVNMAPSFIALPDEADRKFYDVAKASRCYLVTGNRKHFPDEDFIVNHSDILECFVKGVYKCRKQLHHQIDLTLLFVCAQYRRRYVIANADGLGIVRYRREYLTRKEKEQ